MVVVARAGSAIEHQILPLAVLEQAHFIILAHGLEVGDGIFQRYYFPLEGDILVNQIAHRCF